MDERFDPGKPINPVETYLHTSRYRLASELIQKKNLKILDIACGTGYGSSFIHKKTKAHVVGIDIDAKTVSAAKKRFGEKNIEFKIGNAAKLAYPPNTFDVIVSFETLEHLSLENGRKTFKEFKRVLKPKGILIISSPNRFFTNIMKRIVPSYNNPHHKHEYMVSEMKQELRNVNLKLQTILGQYLFFPPFYLLGQHTSFIHSYFYPRKWTPSSLSRYFIVIAEKE